MRHKFILVFCPPDMQVPLWHEVVGCSFIRNFIAMSEGLTTLFDLPSL